MRLLAGLILCTLGLPSLEARATPAMNNGERIRSAIARLMRRSTASW